MTDDAHPGRATRTHRVVFAALLLAHLALVGYSVAPNAVFSGRPIAGFDYQTHYAQTQTLVQGLERFGKFWVYDPHVLAGAPVGLIFDLDNKSHFLFTYALTRLGVPQSVAFNLFGALTLLFAPLFMLFAARASKFSPPAQLFSLAIAMGVWHFDGTARFFWSGGMISFALVSSLAPLILVLFHRMVVEREHRRLWALLFLLPFTLHTHVWTFAILVVPMAGLYLREAKTLDRGLQLRVWALVLFSLLANLHWLIPALAHINLLSPSATVGQLSPLHLFSEYLELPSDFTATGFFVPHTLFRSAAFLAAVLTLWRWRQQRDARTLTAALALLWLFFLTYFAGLLPGLKQTEPFRFGVTLALFASLWAGPWLAEALSWQALRALSAPTRGVLLLLVLLVLPRMLQTALYFMPNLAPRGTVPPIMAPPPSEKNAPTPPITIPISHQLTADIWRLKPVDDVTMALAGYVRLACVDEGRVLVQSWSMGEVLHWASGKPVIGGFPHRRLIHEDANVFRTPTDKRYWGRAFADYLVRYNVRYLVVSDPLPALELRIDLLEHKTSIGPHRVYRVRHLGNYFASGSGKVKATLNRIEVKDAKPARGTQGLVLRFHHMRTLTCKPNCSVERYDVPGDRAGFIAVRGQPRLPAEFVIENGY
ncbi:MAG: hypothetical protein JRH20_20955 [Deltaproteobacteria bacterium]|nr:hypothetical protein [Deltaproteobacteria bacterium]